MKLLVFASTPPPVHGQSLMVQTLVTGLPAAAPDIAVHHVNPRLSPTAADIGRWQLRKLLLLLRHCAQALALRWREGPMIFYYVPAPGKRSALYRDWLVLLLCRPFFPSLVLHWHAVGLGEWLTRQAWAPERWLTQLLLGRAQLALILDPALAADAAALRARRTIVVPNGIPEVPPPSRPARANARREVLFLGLATREKGVFDTLAAVALLAHRAPGSVRLTVAGDFADATERAAFERAAAALPPGVVRLLGVVDAPAKSSLLADADVLCFPTYYPHEGQPLVLLEALAHDLPLVTTRHRAIPSLLPASPHVQFVAPRQPGEIAAALIRLGAAGAPAGALRAHFHATLTRDAHLAAVAAALRALAANTRP